VAYDPRFLETWRTAFVQATAANTNRDGTGTIATVWTAGTSGSRILAITIKAIVTTTAGMIRLYISDGTNIRLWQEIDVTVAVPSGTVKGFSATVDCSDASPTNLLVLPTGYSLRVSTHNAETFNVFAVGGDY
jgi:hypothetical protein